MASSGVVGEIQDSFLSCTICFQEYTNPKALPCLHTFCEGCLRDYIASRYERAGQFPCPVCRQVIYIPANGAGGFPDNHFIISLRDTLEQRRKAGLLNSGSFEADEKIPLIHRASEGSISFRNHHANANIISKFGSFGMAPEQFVHISGLAVSSLTDDVIISDCSLNKIVLFSQSGIYRGGFVCDCSIRDIAVTGSGTILVSVSRAGKAILREYSIDGRLLANYGSFHAHENPFGIAITGRGKVLITSLQYNTLNIFTERKRPSFKFGSRGSGPNHFLLPYYVTVNSRDDIIVSDSGNHRVKMHRNDGTIEIYFGGQGSKPGELFYPMGVCTDMYDNIYVADANNFRVQMFSPQGEFLAFPIQETYHYGMDVKPVNVLMMGKKLFVSFRGTKFAEVHVYHWDASAFKPLKKKSSDMDLFSCCCRKQGMTYEEI